MDAFEKLEKVGEGTYGKARLYTHYSTAMDMSSVGCIFAELITNQALFRVDSELQHILHIFRLLGTPSEMMWPGVSALMNWHEYPQWKPQRLLTSVPNLDKEGLDLLAISAKAAMEHPYFDGLNKAGLENREFLNWPLVELSLPQAHRWMCTNILN